MSDHADRLDAFLNGESGDGENDDHTAFAKRVMREGALPEPAVTEPTQEQRDRIRERVFGEARIDGPGGKPVTTTAFSANGAAPTAMPVQRDDGSRASGLSILMTAALIAIIAVASIGVYRGSLDFLPGGADPNPTGAPGIAAPFEASPEALDSCDLNEQISIFAGTVPDVAGLDTAMTLDSDATLTLVCGGHEEKIADNVRDASPMLWPGVIVYAEENGTVRLLNLSNGTTREIESSATLTEDGELNLANAFYRSGGAEPWLVTPTDTEHIRWRVTDLRSMESILIRKPTNEPSAIPSFEQVTGTEVAVIIWRSDQRLTQPATAFPGGRRMPPDQRALVLPGSIQDRRWIDITEYREYTSLRGLGFSQTFAVSPDGTLLAYTTMDREEPVVRIENAVDGSHVTDVSLNTLSSHTRFLVTDGERHLVLSDGEHLRLYSVSKDQTELLREQRLNLTWWLFPTGDPGTILVSHNSRGTSATPFNVVTGEPMEPFDNIPPVVTQLYGDYELPRNIVRIEFDETNNSRSVIQLVNPATGEVLLESEQVDAHPAQITSFATLLRNEGSIALVPIGYNRAVVMDLTTSSAWLLEVPMDDDRLWRFSLSTDGQFVVARPEPPTGISEYSAGYLATLKPGAEWIPVEAKADTSAPAIERGTPAS